MYSCAKVLYRCRKRDSTEEQLVRHVSDAFRPISINSDFAIAVASCLGGDLTQDLILPPRFARIGAD